MGKKSRDKGKAGEREVARLCREMGYEAHRTAQYRGNTGEAGDVEGLAGVHIEVKRTESFRLYDSLAQARHDATEANRGEIPVVFHRRNNCPWVCILGARDFFTLYREWELNRKDTNDE